MFAFLDLPESFESTKETFSSLSEKVVRHLEEQGEEKLVRADDDLNEIVRAERGLYWVSEGSLILTYQAKRIIAFETWECFGMDTLAGDSPFQLLSELAVKIQYIPFKKLTAALISDNDFASTFVTLQSAYARVLSDLLSTSPLLESPFEPALVPLQKGEVIIEEGDEDDEIYTLVKGRLDVTVQGVKVGDIQEGELFGVIAAFTRSKRTATVKAAEESLVMRLPKEEFDTLVKQRPSLISKLVESLSRTICSLDEKVLENQKTSENT